MANKENQEYLDYIKNYLFKFEHQCCWYQLDKLQQAIDRNELLEKALENSCLYILNEDTPKLDCRIKSESEGYCEYDNNENNECIKCIKGCLLEQARKVLENGK